MVSNQVMSGQDEIFEQLILLHKKCKQRSRPRLRRPGARIAFPLEFPNMKIEGLEAEFVAHLQRELPLCQFVLTARVARRSFKRVACISFDFGSQSWWEYRYDSRDYQYPKDSLGSQDGLTALLQLVSQRWLIINLHHIHLQLPGQGQMEAFDGR
jgi:hypothetical protein